MCHALQHATSPVPPLTILSSLLRACTCCDGTLKLHTPLHTTFPACRVATPVEGLGEATVVGGKYEPPDWGEPFPVEDNVSLDIMKTGTIVDVCLLSAAHTFITFGRNKAADVVVEHPSTSRLHAVLQFRGREAFLVDCGSTHGTFLNRGTLRPGLFYAVHVGSQFRFGQSMRSYILAAGEVRHLAFAVPPATRALSCFPVRVTLCQPVLCGCLKFHCAHAY